jgi:hypothetical protein
MKIEKVFLGSFFSIAAVAAVSGLIWLFGGHPVAKTVSIYSFGLVVLVGLIPLVVIVAATTVEKLFGQKLKEPG